LGLRLHRLDDRERRRLRGAERLETDPEKPATGRRPWGGQELLPPERRDERLSFDHLIVGEILDRDRHVRRDSLRKLAAIETAGALDGDLLERLRQLRHLQALTLFECAPRPVERIALRQVAL